MKACILLVIVLLAPSAAAASFELDAAASGATTVAGATLLTVSEGALDLAPKGEGLGGFTIRWTRAEGYLVSAERTYPGVRGLPGAFLSAEGRRNESLGFDEGSLTIDECVAPCELLLWAEGGGALTLEGELNGALHRTTETKRFSSGANDKQMPDAFLYKVPEGWHEIGSGAAEVATRIADAKLAGRGALHLYMQNVSATVVQADATEDLSTVMQDEDTGTAGLPAGWKRTLRFAHLRIQDAAFDAQARKAVVYAPRIDLRTEGHLFVEDAVGWARQAQERRELDRADVRIEGSLTTILDQGDPDTAGEVLGLAPQEGSLRAAGRASAVSIDGQAWTPAPALGVSARTLAVTGSFLVLALVAAKVILSLLYTRLRKDNILRHPTRARIYAILRDHQGLTVADLRRMMSLTGVVVRHHLRKLEGQGLVVLHVANGVKAWLPTDAAQDPRARIGLLLRDPTRHRLARTLAERGSAWTQREIATQLGLSQRLVSYHLGHLERDGLVTVEGPMPMRYHATDALVEHIVAENEKEEGSGPGVCAGPPDGAKRLHL